jgi:fucose permease
MAAGSALLTMGIACGALVPLLYGHLADVSGLQPGYWVTLPWYG